MITKNAGLFFLMTCFLMFSDSVYANSKILLSGVCVDSRTKKQSEMHASTEVFYIGDEEHPISNIEVADELIKIKGGLGEFLIPKSGGSLVMRMGGKEMSTPFVCKVSNIDEGGIGDAARSVELSALELGCITRFQIYADSSQNIAEMNDPNFAKQFAHGALESIIFGIEDIWNSARANYPSKDWDEFWKRQQMLADLNIEKNVVFTDTITCIRDIHKGKKFRMFWTNAISK